MAYCVALVALTLTVYAPVRHHEFVDYDDYPWIVENPLVHVGAGAEGARLAFTTPRNQNWIPLSTISHQLDYSLFGLDPAGYLLGNVALHACAALLLFLALSRMSGAPHSAAFVAAVFAAHPLHVESVAWASERKDALSGFFWMATLLAYARYVEKPEDKLRYALVLVGLALGLLSKATLITLPCVLLLLDHWPLRRLNRRAVLEKLPMLALAASVSVATLLVQRAGGATAYGAGISFPLRVANAVTSYATYLGQAVWPSGLAVFYPHPLGALSLVGTAAALALLLATTAAASVTARSRPYLIVGWLWYLGTLFPMIGIVPVGLRAQADSYTYVPLVGISIMLAWGVADLAHARKRRESVAAAAALVAVVALAIVAREQVGVWKDTLTLFRHAAAVTNANYVAQQGIGDALRRRGQLTEAANAYRAALEIRPGWRKPANNLAWILATAPDPELRDPETAINLAGNAVRSTTPPDPNILDTLAAAYASAGRFEDAARTMTQAAELAEAAGERSLAHALSQRAERYRQGETVVDPGG